MQESTDDSLLTVAETPDSSLEETILRARRAQSTWAAIDLGERATRLRSIIPKALTRAKEFAATLHSETEKLGIETLLDEVLFIPSLVEYWTQHIESMLEGVDIELDPFLFPKKSGRSERIPLGLIALLTPWTQPVAVAMRHLIPALLAGNAVLFKPSPHTPKTGSLIASLFDGLVPEHLLTILHGDDDLGQAIIEAGVDAVCFTGSQEKGRRVAVLCAEKLIPCSLHLGGKDAAIVLGDAHVERTARGIVWGAFNNAGQHCASIERVYIVRSIADKIVPAIVARVNELRLGHDVAPLVSNSLHRVSSQLDQALDKGAKLLVGGAPEEGSKHFPPTVIQVENESCDVLRVETLGPILPLVLVDDEEQAIERANDSPYALTTSIWTSRIRRGRSIASRLRAGVLTINNHGFTSMLPMAPWSGRGDSGHAVVNGPLSLDAYTRPRFVLMDRGCGMRDAWWYPYDETLDRFAMQMVRMRGGSGFFGRIAAFFALLILLPKRLFRK